MKVTAPTQGLHKQELTSLVKQAQSGDEGAFEQLVLRTRDLARSIAHSVLGTTLLEDAVQESYLLVFRRLGQLRNREAFIGWLSRIVLHVSYRMKKKNPEAAKFPEEISSGDHSQNVADSVTLRTALEQLNQNDREVLILHELVGLSHGEIAYALRIPEGTARSRLHAARRRLAKLLKP